MPLEEWGDCTYMLVIGGMLGKGDLLPEDNGDVSWLKEQMMKVNYALGWECKPNERLLIGIPLAEKESV